MHLADLLRAMESDGRRLAQPPTTCRTTSAGPGCSSSRWCSTRSPPHQDLAVDLGKRATLVVEGADTEVDRSVIEQIRVAHALCSATPSTTGSRRPRGASAQASPRRARSPCRRAQRGDTLLVEVRDDGAGIRPRQDPAHAVERRIAVAGGGRRHQRRRRAPAHLPGGVLHAWRGDGPVRPGCRALTSCATRSSGCRGLGRGRAA